MKALGICGSARENGNTSIIINIVLNVISKSNIETEMIQLFDKTILPCKACFACKGKKRCVTDDDDFNPIFEKMLSSDAIILGSPVYSTDMSAKMKALVERGAVIVGRNPGLFKYKIGAAVAAVRRGGGMTTIDILNHFFLNKEMFVAGSTYWNMVIGRDIGDVLKDDEGIRNMENLGENIVYFLQNMKR